MAKGNRGWNLRSGNPLRVILRGPESSQWKGEDAKPESKRARARRMYQLGLCQRCGQQATERHHIDGNTGNNSLENIAILCRRCHMQWDGRLATWHKNSPSHRGLQPAKLCSNCGLPSKPLRRGRCTPCAQYLRMNGIERPVEFIEHDQRRKSVECEPGTKWCSRCEQIKPLEGFYKYKGRRTSWCKECIKDAARRHWHAKRASA